MNDIICPQCRTRHGPAAMSCDCGHSFKKEEEEPAPPLHFFIAAGFFALIAGIAALLAHENSVVYFPMGGLLFAAVSCMLGIRSWLYYRFNKK